MDQVRRDARSTASTGRPMGSPWRGWDPPGRLRVGQDSVRSDSTPDHMDFALHDRLAVMERRAAVWRPGHLIDPWRALDPADSEAGAEAPTALEILDEPPLDSMDAR
jgi:hypothetical protein